jgi:hypothetical protein
MPMPRANRRTSPVPALAALLLVGLPTRLWASTTVPPPFDFINGLIDYIRRAAIPTIVLALMLGAIAWLFARNGEGIVQWAGKALVVLAIVLGGGTLLASIGFEGAVV